MFLAYGKKESVRFGKLPALKIDGGKKVATTTTTTTTQCQNKEEKWQQTKNNTPYAKQFVSLCCIEMLPLLYLLPFIFMENVRQNKLDAINENRNRTFSSYRKQIVFIRLSLSFVHFHSDCYVFLSGFDFAIGLFLYVQLLFVTSAGSDRISKSLMHN